MYKFAIERPITTLMLFLSLIFFGFMSFSKMNTVLFPKVDFPIITVQTNYYGADPATIESKVTEKIEEAVSSISGLDKMSSVSSEDVSVVTLIFDIEVDITEAANDVRDKISALSLDSAIEKPIVSKLDIGAAPVLSLFIASSSVKPSQLMIDVDEKIKPMIERLKGVGNIKTIGYQDREIRIYPDPFALRKYGITTLDLEKLIQASNVKISGGKLVAEKEQTIVNIRANAMSIESLENFEILQGVKLKDIAKIKDGIEDAKSISTLNGERGVILQIQKLSDANTLNVINRIKGVIPDIEKRIGSDYKLQYFNDTSNFINSSLEHVLFDLIYGGILAIIIVFFFLRNFTATLVSAVAIPTSIIGTFFLMDLFGYDLNKVSMLGLTLAIGIFIDDAIVVIENIYKKMEKGLNKVEASIEGTREIAFSILAISAMLLSVFIPVSMMSSIVGQFFNAFAFTVAIGIFISYFVAVMLIPTLSARVLKKGESKFYHMTEPIFVAIDKSYVKIVGLTIKYAKTTILLAFLTLIGSFSMVGMIGMDFVPKEDKSEIEVTLKAPIGVSLEEMGRRSEAIAQKIKENPYVEYTALTVAYNNTQDAHKAQIYVKLMDVSKRTTTQEQIIQTLRESLKDFKGFERIAVADIPNIKGAGANAPFVMVLQGSDLDELQVVAKKIQERMGKNKGIVEIADNYETGKPELSVEIKREDAANLGVSVQEISSIISTILSSERAVSQFEENGKQYDITMRFSDEYRKSVEDLKRLEVKTANGDFVALEGLVNFENSTGPASINHYNRQRQISIEANLAGVPLGEAVSTALKGIEKDLGDNIKYSFLGMAEEMGKMGKDFSLAFGLAFLMMFIILAALYESLLQPLIIMVALPLSFIGVLLALILAGKNFNLFTMMGIILLMGMVGKNAVLLVDFANQQLKKGLSVTEALVLAGEKRLRPILMTTFAMVFAMLPLVFMKGAGYESNSPMATAVVGGLISSMLLTLLIVPAIYKFLSPLDIWMRKFYDLNFMKESP
ncbi:efflux RND transporter permease subunit [Sulfurimonas lithotrophica]|uniref:Efflux RND transporter permease subunit n=1 Tax=Sulfurimonas lithotrophica TaxID=2590022 RepID=A0A5P8P1T5_9BACT|nr:efflux RND transporter permease subunit [Sulfurimonas lithotrophica]QFR49581.1 efflux RND transporter permease subunit [Sulfurimonas lithotrophica]